MLEDLGKKGFFSTRPSLLVQQHERLSAYKQS